MKKIHEITNKKIKVNGIDIFYRVAGDKTKPAVLLLHGFPSSSVMFKNLMHTLCDKYYLIAPDFPGFGFSDFPDPEKFEYSFENIAKIINAFTDKIDLKEFVIYLHDYGCPVGLRICRDSPEKIKGIIIQSGNAHAEGIGSAWDEVKDYWAHSTAEKKKKVFEFLSEEGTKYQYYGGLPKHLLEKMSPELWVLDWALMSRPGNIEMQMILNTDYQSNIKMYPLFQEYLKKYQPPALVLWGKYDVFFDVKEVEAYRRDLPKAEVHVLEGGHMSLETNFTEVAKLIDSFLEKTYKLKE